ncbi:MAG: ABC transporter transmembrane domain-containing protein, partial [Acidimicrobiia bacterium]
AAWVDEQVGWSATNQLLSHLTSHCVDLDMGFHKTRTPGELLERIDGDVTALFNFFSQFAIHVVGNAALLVGWWWRSSWRTCGWAWGWPSSPPDRSSS